MDRVYSRHFGPDRVLRTSSKRRDKNAMKSPTEKNTEYSLILCRFYSFMAVLSTRAIFEQIELNKVRCLFFFSSNTDKFVPGANFVSCNFAVFSWHFWHYFDSFQTVAVLELEERIRCPFVLDHTIGRVSK